MNPFQGSLQGNWYHVALHMDEYGLLEFLVESPYFFSQTPILLCYKQSAKQNCVQCRKHIDEELNVFVVYRIRNGIEHQFVSKIALLLDKEDVMCSKEKFQDFLKWQLEEHQKTCGKGNTTPPAT